MKGIALLQGEIIAKSKNALNLKKKIFFFRTSKPNQSNLVQIILG
jgi:hypothetical protein